MTWQDLSRDFIEHWPLYLSMPVIAAVIGYITKILAIRMMFQPLEFVGIRPWFGWQGVVPARARHMAEISVDLMTERLINPRDMFDRLDTAEIARRLEGHLGHLMEDVTTDVMRRHYPRMWESVPQIVRQRLYKRIQAETPAIIAELFDDLKYNIDRVFDMKHTVVNALTRDKVLLNAIFQEVGEEEFAFIRRSGIYFGFVIGIVQMFVWMLTHSSWVMPLFGGLTGLVTDWLALRMIFYPKHRTTYLGIFSWQGLFLRRQHQVAEKYGNLMATRILTSSTLMEGLLTGPLSHELHALVHRHVRRAIDRQVGVMKPVLLWSMGTDRYQDVKVTVAERIIARLPETFREMEGYVESAMDVRGLLVAKMQAMTKDEFESVLRPVFRQDEWKLIACGAVLGFLVGELQVWLMLT